MAAPRSISSLRQLLGGTPLLEVHYRNRGRERRLYAKYESMNIFLGAVQRAEELADGTVAITVFSDSNKKYLSTDLCGDEPTRDDSLTPHIELLGFRALR